VGAAAVIEALGARSWSVAPLPVGSGRVGSRHGSLPVPAPATARLLEGFAVLDDGIAGERVTPTGAAILGELAPAPRLTAGPWRLQRTGHGFGTKRVPGISNVLRLISYVGDEAGRNEERVAVITFEVDDQTPEDLAVGLDRLRRQEGVLDVVQIPVVVKKGRLATQVQVLTRPARVDRLIECCFVETTTIGLRWRAEARPSLSREKVAVGAEGAHVKVVARPGGGRTAKAEIEQVKEVEGHAERVRTRQRAEDIALGEEADEER
jgi:pyridinium-3,5-bisthiocarboxylic acid mononucleotide nickel chelatase